MSITPVNELIDIEGGEVSPSQILELPRNILSRDRLAEGQVIDIRETVIPLDEPFWMSRLAFFCEVDRLPRDNEAQGEVV